MGNCAISDRGTGPTTITVKDYDFYYVIGRGGFGQVSPRY